MNPALPCRYRYSLRTLFVLVTLCAIGAWLLRPDDYDRLQGTWRGTGKYAGLETKIEGRQILWGIAHQPPPETFTLDQRRHTMTFDSRINPSREICTYSIDGDDLTLSWGTEVELTYRRASTP